MQISEVQITPIKPRDGLVGFASLIFNDSLYLNSIGIYTRPEGGFRLTYPTKKEDGLNLFHPINKKIGNQIEQAVIAKFEKVVGQKKALKIIF